MLISGNEFNWGTITVGSTASTGSRFTILGVGGVSCLSEGLGNLPFDAGITSRRPPPPPPPDFSGFGGRFKVNWLGSNSSTFVLVDFFTCFTSHMGTKTIAITTTTWAIIENASELERNLYSLKISSTSTGWAVT